MFRMKLRNSWHLQAELKECSSFKLYLLSLPCLRSFPVRLFRRLQKVCAGVHDEIENPAAHSCPDIII